MPSFETLSFLKCNIDTSTVSQTVQSVCSILIGRQSVTMKDLFDHSLARGADVHWSRDLDGWSGLHSAARFNNGELLELLLAQTGVDVNIRDNRNTTPLMFACISGHENIVRRLCQVTDIQLNNTRKDDGRTALHCAVIYNKTAACASVMRGVAGVDWNVRDNAGNSPLTEAVELGRTDILQTILSVPEPHLDLNVTDSKGRNIAQIAVEHNRQRQRCVELLSGDKRVDRYWNIKNSDGDTPVMYCLKNNKTEIARCLINTPVVDLDTVDSDGRHLEEIARSIFPNLEQSNNFFISQGEEYD